MCARASPVCSLLPLPCSRSLQLGAAAPILYSQLCFVAHALAESALGRSHMAARRDQEDYEVIRKVGRGKYSEVFEGINVVIDQVCPTDPQP